MLKFNMITFVPHAQTAPWQEAHVIWTQMRGPRPKLPGHVHGQSQTGVTTPLPSHVEEEKG